ncbi:MAG: hypothetical protein NC114_11700 [Ruminococcus flavefaciens]|nr:hypothetical protein [Ruminococcus flavefaciens]
MYDAHIIHEFNNNFRINNLTLVFHHPAVDPITLITMKMGDGWWQIVDPNQMDKWLRPLEGDDAPEFPDLIVDESSGCGARHLAATLNAGAGQTLFCYPESYLHPAWSIHLGDYFLWRMRRNMPSLVVTHSEHLMLRIIRRIKEDNEPQFPLDRTPEIPLNKISIYYVCKDMRFVSIGINDFGEFTSQWPDGFFKERYVDLFS